MFHKHHKVFRSQGGTDDPENLELLTPLEHAELHVEVFLSGGPWFDNRQEGWKLLSDDLREKVCLEQSRRRTELNSGRKWSEETKQKISVSRTGQTLSDEHKQKISDSLVGENNPMTGKLVTQETREKQRQAAKQRPKVTCPHCQKTGSSNTMKRWHFENCRFK
jgi:hypothetical protein